jgi:hypothetical protein
MCSNGKHSLIEVSSCCIDHDTEMVTRWCTVCGAVVVDKEYDGRIQPGYYMQMKFPSVYNDEDE